MSDRFKMEGVLRHRKHLEEAAQTAFSASLRKWSQARGALEDLARSRRQYQKELKRKMQVDAAADELLLYHRYLGRLENEIESQTVLLEALEVEKEEKRTQLLVALKDRKVLEKLKEHHLDTEDRNRRAQEQKLMNEAAVNRYLNRQRQSDSTEKD